MKNEILLNNSTIKLQNENISKWYRRLIYGIDFSGAQDAGKKIWIAKGVVKGDSLLIEDCFRARD